MVVSTRINSYDIARAMIDGALGSARGLEKVLSPNHAAMQAVLGGSCPMSFVHKFSDFTEDSTDLTVDWVLDKDTGATDFAYNAALGGTIRGETGTTDNDGHSITGAAIWQGDKNALFLGRLKVGAVVSGHYLAFGFLDAITEDKDPAVSDIDTPTFAAGIGDAALLVRDTDQTLTTLGLATLNSASSSTDGLTTLSSATLAAKTATTWAPTADTYFSLLVALNGDNVHAAVFNEDHRCLAYAYDATGIDGETLVAAFVQQHTRNTTTKTLDWDYYLLLQDR